MADEPIVISGGSVTIDFSDKYTKENGAGRKKYKNKNGKLLRLQVNNEPPRELNPGDKVIIICDDGA